MADYIYLFYEDQPLADRFPVAGTYGIPIWRKYIQWLVQVLTAEGNAPIRTEITTNVLQELQELTGDGPTTDTRPIEQLILVLLQTNLRRAATTIPANRCPCLFISHRQPDTLIALRMAQIAARNGFDYWVDVLDPALKLLAANPLIPQPLIPLLTACLIEVALINCTHVIACMTPNSKGSQWIPYEYGRITEIPGLYNRSCAWQHPKLPVADHPEYMYLGITAKTEGEIDTWLQSTSGWFTAGPCGQDHHEITGITELEQLTDDDQREFEAWLAAGMPLTRDIKALPVIQLKPRSA